MRDPCQHDDTDGAVDIYECAAMGCRSCLEWITDQEADWKVEERVTRKGGTS